MTLDTLTSTTPAVNRTAHTLLLVGALYVAQGIPLGFVFEALPVLLRAKGVALETIALLPFAGLPWILKLLWAPLVDNRWIAGLGRRRSWILPMQAILALSMVPLALLPLNQASAPWIGLLVLLGAFAAATQDTATDGLAAERLYGRALSWANALQVGGMMAGFMIGGAGVLLLTEALGYPLAVAGLALLLFLALMPAIFWKETRGSPTVAAQSRGTAGGARIRKSFERRAIWPLLLVALCSGTIYTGSMTLSKLMLSDLGWSLSAVGGIAALSALGMILIGSPLGSWTVSRIGICPALVAGILVVGLSQVGWLLIGQGWIDPTMAAGFCTSLLMGAGGGMASVAASTLAMRFAAKGEQAGTDVTILQSTHVVGEMLASGLAVGLAAAFGYSSTFLGGLGAGLVIVLIVRWAARLRATRPYIDSLEVA